MRRLIQWYASKYTPKLNADGTEQTGRFYRNAYTGSARVEVGLVKKDAGASRGEKTLVFTLHTLRPRIWRIPQLLKILEFERATVATLTDGQARIVRFDPDPLPILRALAEGHLIENPGEPGEYEIEVTPDGPIRVAGIDPALVSQTFPFH